MRILRADYDALANKTHCLVETREFRDWMWFSGQAETEMEALTLLGPVITAKLDDLIYAIPNDHKRVTNAFGWSNGNPEVAK